VKVVEAAHAESAREGRCPSDLYHRLLPCQLRFSRLADYRKLMRRSYS